MTQKESFGKKQARQSHSQARIKATDAQWELIDIAIRAFKSEYPLQWIAWERHLKNDRDIHNPYQQPNKLQHKELHKTNWRHCATFPTIVQEVEGEFVIVDSLEPTLEKIIPKLFHEDSINFIPFLKKYPCFVPGSKI